MAMEILTNEFKDLILSNPNYLIKLAQKLVDDLVANNGPNAPNANENEEKPLVRPCFL